MKMFYRKNSIGVYDDRNFVFASQAVMHPVLQIRHQYRGVLEYIGSLK